jgi:hypothetical protein
MPSEHRRDLESISLNAIELFAERIPSIDRPFKCLPLTSQKTAKTTV